MEQNRADADNKIRNGIKCNLEPRRLVISDRILFVSRYAQHISICVSDSFNIFCISHTHAQVYKWNCVTSFTLFQSHAFVCSAYVHARLRELRSYVHYLNVVYISTFSSYSPSYFPEIAAHYSTEAFMVIMDASTTLHVANLIIFWSAQAENFAKFTRTILI